MTMLILQTLLLMAIAYILGCIIGCLLHQWFGSAPKAASSCCRSGCCCCCHRTEGTTTAAAASAETGWPGCCSCCCARRRAEKGSGQKARCQAKGSTKGSPKSQG